MASAGEDARARWRRTRAVTTALNDDATSRARGSARSRRAGPAAMNDRTPRKRRMSPGSRATSLVPIRAPTIKPEELGGLHRRGHEAPGSLVELEHLLVEEAGEATRSPIEGGGEERQRPPDATEGLDPMADARSASPKLGGASSVMIASSLAPMARRSCSPRTGSFIRRPSSTTMIVGTANTKNGTRQLELNAMTPASNGPMKAPTALAARWKRVHLRPVLGRVVVGDERVVGGIDHRLADRRAGASDDEEPHA